MAARLISISITWLSGRPGIAIIETKTRRKRRACKEGRKSHEVVFDGQRLLWPWGQDACGCDQVVAQADWLRKWIEQRTALRIDPKPFLTFPGWFVSERAVGNFRVANPKMLPSVVSQWRPQQLTADQVDLICRNSKSAARVED